MKNIILFGIVLLTCSCKTNKYVPIETRYNYIDTTIVNYKDSLIYIEIPSEKNVKMTNPFDTLHLETSTAIATAYIDTINDKLVGEIENKNVQLPKTIYVPSETRVIKEIIEKEVPKEIYIDKMYIPKWIWYTIGCLLIVIGFQNKRVITSILKQIL